MPWRVVTVEAVPLGSVGRVEGEGGKREVGRSRLGKKRRIIFRKRAVALKAQRDAASVGRAEREAAERESRTRKNREKKVKRKIKDKAKKALQDRDGIAQPVA
jgi:flagellar motility protein MotE (MotC chaperone)